MFYWPYGEIFLDLGFIVVYWYGFLMFVGVLTGFLIVYFLFKKYRVDVDFLYTLAPYLIIGGFAGARLYHVLNEWQYYVQNPADIFLVRQGGLAIHGAILFGIAIVWIFAKKYYLNFKHLNIVSAKSLFLFLFDVFAPAVAIGQAIGRWGNFFNQELYGRPTSSFLSVYIEPAFRQAGYEQFSYFQPVFFYEFTGLVIIFIILFYMHLYKIKNKSLVRWGSIGGWYFVLYGVLRLYIETLRIDSVPYIFGLRLPFVVSFLFIVVGCFIIWYINKKGINQNI